MIESGYRATSDLRLLRNCSLGKFSMLRPALLALVLIFQPIAHAQGDPYGLADYQSRQAGVTPINHYFGTSAVSLLFCSLAFQARNIEDNSLKDIDKPPKVKVDYRVCIERHRVAVKTLYDTAMNSVKSPAIKAALKEHFILTISALEGINPQPNERVGDYERRTNAEKRAMDQQRIRVEAEL